MASGVTTTAVTSPGHSVPAVVSPPVVVSGGIGGGPVVLESIWEVFVRAAPDYHTLLCQIPLSACTSLQFAVQLNDKGSGTITMDLDNADFWGQTLGNGQVATTLWDDEHLIQVAQNGTVVFEFLATTVTEQYVDQSEQRVVTVTGNGSIETLSWGAAMPPGFPNIVFKTDAIQDGFAEVDGNGNLALDVNIWNLVSPSSSVSLNPSGTLQLAATPGTTYCGATPYDITNSSISAQVTPIFDSSGTGAAGLDGSQVSMFYVQDVATAKNYAMIALSGNTFYCQVGDSVAGSTITKQLTAYSPQSHPYWRISEAGGTFYFWTSADGVNWVKQWFCAHKWTATKIDVYFAARYDKSSSQIMQVTNLNSEIVTPTSTGNTYFGEPIMGVWYQIFQAAQARGTIPFVTTRLNGSHDSFGNPWTDSNSVQIQNGTDLYSLLQSHAAIVNAQWFMRPGFELVVGLQGSSGVTLGNDYSKTIVLRESGDVLTRQRVRARDKLANLIGGVNSDGTTISDSDSASISKWGQREGWVQTATQVNPQSMATATAASLEATKDEVLSWTMTIPPDELGAVPFYNFNVGDWVGAERPGGGSTVDAVQVVALAISIDATGLVTCEPTVNSYRQWLAEQLNYIVQKMGGSFINSLGTTPVTNEAASQYGVPVPVAPQLSGLSDVSTGVPGSGPLPAGTPLLYSAATGQWQPASLDGQPVTITLADGSTMTLGGSSGITVTDPTGILRQVVGPQSDGTLTAKDLNAPAPVQPDTPIVAPGIQSLLVGWDGRMSDGSAPLSDWIYTEVHCSTAANFVPSTTTLQGHIQPGGTFTITGLNAGTTYYVALVAVNTSRVSSTPSAEASGVPQNVTSNIPAGSITAGMVAFTASAIGGVTATFSPTAPGSPAVNDLWYDTSNGNVLKQWNGSAWVPYQWGAGSLAAGAVGTGNISFTARDIGGITVSVQATAPTGAKANDLWYDSSNGYTLNVYSGSAWSAYQFGTNAIAAGSVTAALIAAGTITATQIAAGTITGANIAAQTITANNIAANTITATLIASGTITASQIAAGTITATQLAAGTITGNKISAGTITASLLAAGIVVAGIVDATTITGSTLQNSTTHPKTSINSDGSVSITNASGGLVWKVASDGTMSWYLNGAELLMQLQPGGNTLIYASSRGPSSWSFEDGGTDSWTAQHGTEANSTTWSSDGTHSLKVTSNGGGSSGSPWGATSPQFSVNGGEYMNAYADVEAGTTALNQMNLGLSFWDSHGTFISTISGTATVAIAASSGVTLTLSGVQAPANAATAAVVVSDAEASASGVIMYIDNVLVPGGLAYSNSPSGGTDSYGNQFPQGTTFYGVPGLTSALTIEDDHGNTVAGIDGSGNISGQVVNAADDVFIQGNSLLNTLLTDTAGGLMTRGWCPATGTTFPWPSSAISNTETALAEIDVQLFAGRLYRFNLTGAEDMSTDATTAVFRAFLYVRYTTDGSTPTTSSTELFHLSNDIYSGIGTTYSYICGGSQWIIPSATATYKFLVSARTNSSSHTMQLQNPIYFDVEDCGQAGNLTSTTNNAQILGSGGSGGGSGPTTITATFNLSDAASYYGDDASGSPQAYRCSNLLYQGEYSGGGVDGHQYSGCLMEYTNFRSQVGSNTITKATLKLTCSHSWYNTGMNVLLGGLKVTSLPRSSMNDSSTNGDWGGHDLGNIGEGATKTFDITSTGIAQGIATGTYTGITFGPAKAYGLAYYGYYAGFGSGHGPSITVTYVT